MIVILWRGAGFLIAVFIFGCPLAASLITNHVTGSSAYWDSHSWPNIAALLAAAALSYIATKVLYAFKTRKVTDPSSGQTVLIRPLDSLLFIPISYWPLICMGLAGLVALLRAF